VVFVPPLRKKTELAKLLFVPSVPSVPSLVAEAAAPPAPPAPPKLLKSKRLVAEDVKVVAPVA